MSVDIPCQSIWDKVKGETIRQDIGLVAALTAKAAKWVDSDYTFDIDGHDIVFKLDRDIHTICPGTKTEKVLKWFGGKGFDNLVCDGLNSFAKDKKLSEALRNKITHLCPRIIQSCTPTICNGKAESISLSCKDVKEIFDAVLQDPTVIAEIPFGVDLSKKNPCEKVQVLSNMGINITEILASLLANELTKIGINVSKENYAAIIKCVCPNLKMGQSLDCAEANSVISAILAIPEVQNLISKEAGLDFNDQNKCDVLQEFIDVGKDPARVIHDILEKTLENKEYVLPIETVEKIVKCLCPDLKPLSPPTVPPVPEDVKRLVIYNRIYIAIGMLITLVSFIIIYVLIVVFSKPWSKLLAFFLLLLSFGLVWVLLFVTNFRCWMKACVSAGDDWELINGTFSGKATKLGLTIDAKLDINGDTATILVLDCKGAKCPFRSLLDKCKDPTITPAKQKGPFGYPLLGPCIDELYKLHDGSIQTVQSLSISQHQRKIQQG